MSAKRTFTVFFVNGSIDKASTLASIERLIDAENNENLAKMVAAWEILSTKGSLQKSALSTADEMRHFLSTHYMAEGMNYATATEKAKEALGLLKDAGYIMSKLGKSGGSWLVENGPKLPKVSEVPATDTETTLRK